MPRIRDGRFGAARVKINRVTDPFEFILEHRSTRAPWLNIEQLHEPSENLLSSSLQDMNPSTYNYIAIDVSKSTLQIQSESKAWKIKYSESELARFVQEVKKLSSPLVVFEASGGQERLLQDRLAESKVAFHIVNTRRIWGFAASGGIRAKTDPIAAPT